MSKIMTISIDIETYSDIDLQKCGVYKYVESDSFEILLFGYSINGGEVIVIDLAQGEVIPKEILFALTDNAVIKWAFNAQFERICLSAYLRKNYPQHFASYSIAQDSVGNYLDPSAWRCSMIWSAYMGLPLSLAGVGAVLGLSEQKLKEGKELIRYFCIPCKATKANGGRQRNLPCHDLAKWNQFVSYNKRDVEVEMAIQNKLSKYPVPDFIWEEYHLDQEINDRGIYLDMDVVTNAIAIDEYSKKQLNDKMQELTKLENPNSVTQMKQWLSENGIETDSLDKKAVATLMKTADKQLCRVLLLRQQLAKSSVKKYQAMENVVCKDGRARGMFQFYGANRSGRWAGRLIQLQNLPQNHMADLSEARALVKEGNIKALELLYDDIPDTLSQLIRTAFIPQNNMKFKEKNIPVFFEKENINTMDSKGEVLLTIMASLAQQESESLSKNVKLGIQFRYQRGEVQVNHNRFIGYTKDENGKLVIEPAEAEVVKRIYLEYLQGASLRQIGNNLMAKGILTGAGKEKWRPETIKKILQNEKYIGDALLQKTYTVDVLTKRRVPNNGLMPQYYVENSHEAIIPRDLNMQVQEEILRRGNLHSGANRKKRVYSSKYALSSIVYCPKCGDIYRRVAWNNHGKHSIVWRCVNRVEHGPSFCDASTIKETDLQVAVVKAMNLALGGKDEMLATLKENIATVIALEDESSVESINAKLNELQQELLKRANSGQDYNDLADEIDHLRELKQNALVEDAEREGFKQRIAEMQQFLAEQADSIEEYDEALVRRMIEKITVYEDKFTVEFKSGISVDVER